MLYIGTLALSSICLAFLALVIKRNPSLHEPGEPPSPAAGVINALLFLVALGLSLAWPVLSYYPLLLLIGADWLTALWTRMRQSVLSLTRLRPRIAVDPGPQLVASGYFTV